MARVAQVVEGHLDIRVVDRPLDDVAIFLGDGGPGRLGLLHHVTDRPHEHSGLHRAVESDKHAQLPVSAGLTRFLRKPNIQLPPRQRKCQVIKFHVVAYQNL